MNGEEACSRSSHADRMGRKRDSLSAETWLAARDPRVVKMLFEIEK
jgi:hypothetical protein